VSLIPGAFLGGSKNSRRVGAVEEKFLRDSGDCVLRRWQRHLRPVAVAVAGEEPARALDTALQMLAVAGPENRVLEGFILNVSVK
jgi:hypothetical protein